ncbi:histidine kinase [Rhodococcus pyridinivorans]|uniref:sensor histidine kinase n=1 Tax=Rhodococcus pyridinivorans TaxID=103816 RepID=UPI001E4BC08C|nr:histidine kinase [Rhodococcus pyridinivorans]MCD5421057.1 histidine kinase [Rhodococcus pyridinivorans]
MIDHLRRSLGTSVRAVVGLLLGIVTAVTGVAASARRTTDGPGRAAERDRIRLVRWFDAEAVRDLPDREPTGYFLVRLAYGPLVGLVVLLVLISATGYGGWAIVLLAGGRISVADGLVSLLVAAVMIYLSVRMAMIVGQWDVRTALRLLGDDATQHRLRDLQRTRADVVTAIDDERRRIERALHDDVQQRAVALALDVGRARRTAERGGNLVADLDNAVAQAQTLLTELRDVAWRIYPAALDEHGLAAALEGLSAHTSLPVDLDLSIHPEPPHDVAAAAYYVAAEGVTNATKHSGADNVSVTVAADGHVVTVTVVDDGCGGAEMTGFGLTGLARRVAALDGQFSVHSPRGGPTVVEARIPCAS